MSSVNTRTVPSISNLSDDNSKRFHKRFLLWLLWRTCLSISEMKQMKTVEKDARTLEIYRSAVRNAKVNEVAIELRCELPGSDDWEEIKKLSLYKFRDDEGGDAVSICVLLMIMLL